MKKRYLKSHFEHMNTVVNRCIMARDNYCMNSNSWYYESAFNNALNDIAYAWHNAPITKAQRVLLGKNAMQQIKSIYKTL
jgi:hypothetical protein